MLRLVSWKASHTFVRPVHACRRRQICSVRSSTAESTYVIVATVPRESLPDIIGARPLLVHPADRLPRLVWMIDDDDHSMNIESIAPGKGVLMPPVKVEPAKVKTFENAIAFYRWLSAHH